ncbi:MAG: biosynthetic-type acetolactate synthase large subunit [Oscillospiraceae bacterium]|nr:biosynthetic-type acetolactate synthase large subunit [Oscillospiraceae bacterium]
MLYTGAQILIKSLIEQGVDVLFGYPGGAVLYIYDALYGAKDQIRHIVSSHEQGAAHAADGYARSTGKTGVVLATSGPGATNLVTGLATAYLDSVPVVAITGNVTQELIGRDSFQEVDIISITKTVVKKNYFVTAPGDIPRVLRDAFECANSGRKGPVLIDIPKDVTAEMCGYVPCGRFEPVTFPVPGKDSLAHAVRLISQSQRPLIFCGGGVTFTDAAEKLQAFAQKLQIPVCMSMMGLSSMPAGSELNLGLVGMHGTSTANMAVGSCDLLLAVGARFSDRVAGDRTRFARDAAIIHLDIDDREISKNVAADASLIGDAGATLGLLTAMLPDMKHADWLHTLLRHKALNALPYPKSEDETVNPREILLELAPVAGPDAVVATDVGQHQMFTAQYYPFSKPRTFLSSCGLGTMGYGMGAAIGAAVGHPEQPVVLVTGDGSFHMNLQELAVAVSHNLPLVVLVMNNGVLGMVHQWQNLFYESRYAYTEINRKTDFVRMAQAFGAAAMRIEKRADIRPVLKKALDCGGPCVVDCVISPEQRVYPIIPPGKDGSDMIFSQII